MASIDKTYGLLFDVTVLSAALFGAALLQGWIYYRKYGKTDPWAIQALVGIILALDTCQLALLSHSVYDYLVTHHGDDNYLAVQSKDLSRELYFSAFIALFVQSFYIYRIYCLTKNLWIVSPLVALSWVAFGVMIAYSTRSVELDFVSGFMTFRLRILSTVCQAFSAVTDIAISVVMIYILQRSKTGMRRTTDMLNRLIIFTFNAGIPTAVCAFLCLLLVNISVETYWYVFFYILVGRFFTNSLLVMLNSRDYIRSGSQADGTDAVNTFALGPTTHVEFNPRHRSIPPETISVRIEKTTRHDAKGSQKESSQDHSESRDVDSKMQHFIAGEP